MPYRSLYEYFMAMVIKPGTKILDGEKLKEVPTQKEANTALKTLWVKLGGTIGALLISCMPLFAAVTPETEWQDVPPTNTLGVALASWPTTTQATNIVTNVLSKIHINGQQLSDNVNITTFAPFKTSWRNSGGTMNQLCDDISKDSDATVGMCFMGIIEHKDVMPDVHLGNFEVTVKICKNGVLNFEAFSTDTATKHWDGVGFGSSFMGWRQVVTAPEKTENGVYILKMTVSEDGHSKTYEWVKE